MKINEILIREAPDTDPGPDLKPDTTQSRNVPAGATPKRTKNRGDGPQMYGNTGIPQADVTNVRQMYAKNPELLALIQRAIQLPHITSVTQAINYANTELIARRQMNKGTLTGVGQGDEVWKDVKPQDWKGHTDAGAPRGFSRNVGRQLSKGFEGPKKVPGLDAVKAAGAAILDFAGDTYQTSKGIDPGHEKYKKYSNVLDRTLGKFTGDAKTRARDWASQIRGDN